MLSAKKTEEPDVPDLVTILSSQKVGDAINLMQQYSISQLPVVRNGEVDSLADVIGRCTIATCSNESSRIRMR